jgi:Na+-driven multidrug efflux pump
VAYGLVMAAILFAISRPTTSFFDDDPVVIDVAAAYLRIVPFSYAGFGVMMIAVAVFNSLARPMPAAILTFLKFFIVYLPLAWGLSVFFGLSGIFWANALAHLLFGAVSYVWLKKVLNNLENVVPSSVE